MARRNLAFDTNFVRDLVDANGFTGEKVEEEMDLQGVSGVGEEIVDDVLSPGASEEEVNSILKLDIERGCGKDVSPSEVTGWKNDVERGFSRSAWEEARTRCDLGKSFDEAVEGAEADAELLNVASRTGSKVVTSDKSLQLMCRDRLGEDRCITPFE